MMPVAELSRFDWAGQRMRLVIACADLGRDTGHGRQVLASQRMAA